ncbi:MAG TPA: hypothetical protein VFO28_18795 [Burkholderiaceae bacterium]|nr:hypothetical protein [Burkholderiaceae bacterium]
MPIRQHNHAGLALAIVGFAALPSVAAAQAGPADAWRFGASLYGYLPSLSGSTSVPADSAGTPINVDAGKVVDSLKFTFMGALEAHNGRWGVFSDLIYLHLGGDKQGSRDFSIGSIGLPAGTTADLSWNLKGWVWTVAGEYRVASDPAPLTLSVLAGTRLFDLKENLRWNIAGNLGPIAGPGRSGESENQGTLWDGIVGVKGRWAIGGSGRWHAPFYADIGTGRSDLTWQLAGGVSYAYPWGDVLAMYRHLAYDMKSGKSIKDLSFSGPMVGATFRW